MTTSKQPEKRFVAFPLFLLLIIYAVVVAVFFVIRYQAHWTDTDTPILTRSISSMDRTEQLIPNDNDVYSMGFLYSSLSTFIVKVTGIPVETLQLQIWPVLAAILFIFLTTALFREFIHQPNLSFLGALVFFMQPDILFVIFRGSHEKLTRALTILLLYLLLKGYGNLSNLRKFSVYIGLFYVVAFALASTHIFFTSSILSATALSFVGGQIILRLQRSREHQYSPYLGRLFYTTLSLLVILSLMMFYLYPPAQLFLTSLKDLSKKLSILFLGADQAEPLHNSYQIVGYGWINVPTYLLLTMPTWIMLLVSLITWLSLFRSITQKDPSLFVLWLLYAAFAAQVAIGMVADTSGMLGANLQLRLFSSFMQVAIPMAIIGLRQWFALVKVWQLRRLSIIVLLVFILWSSGASLLKMVNEPMLSNYWTFYTEQEEQGLEWSNDHLRHQSIWVDFDALRFRSLLSIMEAQNNSKNSSDILEADPATRYFWISKSVQLWGSRNHDKLPSGIVDDRIYDSGNVQLYHSRSRTPYQE